jgi:4-hydroxybenzoate polyprenyltransferase
MDTLKGIVSDIRIFLYGGMVTLPLTIAGTMMILGLFTANYAILFFLLGFLIIAPLSSWIINIVLGWIFVGRSFNPFRTQTTDICKLTVPYTTFQNPVGIQDISFISSPWVAMISFFIGYIFTNGIELHNREVEDTTITVESDSGSELQSRVTKRTTQAIIAMVSIVFFALMALGYRYYSRCETIPGMILTSGIFVFLGYSWYRALSSVGEDRLSDIFGVANRLLSPDALVNQPMACLPSA